MKDWREQVLVSLRINIVGETRHHLLPLSLIINVVLCWASILDWTPSLPTILPLSEVDSADSLKCSRSILDCPLSIPPSPAWGGICRLVQGMCEDF
ncbi:hypothetical protein Pmani_017052 [Petrolisthes manimaculis]|uniref:Uncharacterized protein n=1 Tax=Petrolisthes manimaculis TaxID=1843537 RepID=A0AAE1PMK0_9EUCA|nr:hypothetical protein Pmani_017052 [Petrolisthes manimaculis]